MAVRGLPTRRLVDPAALAPVDVHQRRGLFVTDIEPKPIARALARFDPIDDSIDRWWERFRGQPAVDRIFYSASEAGDFSLLWHTWGVAKAVVQNDPRPAIELSLALGIESALVNGPIKSVFARRRPIHETDRPHTLRTPKTSSFPSGHASAAMVAATMLSRGSRFKALYFGAGAVVAFSRVHVRIHHASDVAGGLAVGLVLGAAAKRVAESALGGRFGQSNS